MNAGSSVWLRWLAAFSGGLAPLASARLLACLAMFCAWGAAAEELGLPVAKLNSISPAGGKQGTTFEVVVDGANLDDAAELRFSDPGVTAVAKMAGPELGELAPLAVPGQFFVTIRPDAKVGLCDARVIGKYGISNPRAFVVGALDELEEREPNNSPEQATPMQVGSTVNGRSDRNGDVDFFKFSARKGQRILLDVSAYRIDSRMDATLTLYNAAGDEIAHDRDTNRLDPLISFTAPEDGEYCAAVFDFLYGGGDDYFYRLTISSAPYVDFVFPPAGQAGARAKFAVYGRNLPGGERAEGVKVGNQTLERLEVEIPLPADRGARDLSWEAPVEASEAGLDAMEWHLDSPAGPSNSVLVGVVSTPVVVEREPNDTPDKAQRITPPCEVCGQFNPRRDQDRFEFVARQGEEFWIEVISERLGEPTDPWLTVEELCPGEEKPRMLQDIDDTMAPKRENPFDISTEDPFYAFKAPADGVVSITVRNLYYTSTGDPRHMYRLAIHRPQPDFRLAATPRMTPAGADLNQASAAVWSTLLRRGGGEVIEVYAYRRDGFAGEIEIRAEGLPPGVTAAPITIAPDQNVGRLVLEAAEDAPVWIGDIQIVGAANIDGVPTARQARPATFVWAGKRDASPTRTRLARGLPLAVAPEQAPYTVSAGAGAVVETCRGRDVTIPVHVERHGDFNEKISILAFGLPKELVPKPVTLEAGQSETTLEIAAPVAAKPGAYSFSVLGVTEYKYARNPESVQTAEVRKVTIDRIVAERSAAAQQAETERARTEQASREAANTLAQAKVSQAIAEQTLAEESAAADAAAEQSKLAQAASLKQSNNDSLARAAEAAEQTANEVAARAKAAAEAKTAAERNVAAMDELAKAAALARAAATAAEEAARSFAAEAISFQQRFNQTVIDLVNQAKPRPVRVGEPSASLTLKVTPAPVSLQLEIGRATIHSGQKAPIPVKVTRLYGYDGPVQIRVRATTQVAGIEAPAIELIGEQTTAELPIEVTADAKPGPHRITVEACARLKNQELLIGEDLQIEVQAGG